MKKLMVIIFLMSGLQVYAQSDRIDSLLNDLVYNSDDPLIVPEEPLKYDFIYAGSNFSNKTFYAGREVDDKMYNVSGNLYYYNSSGLYAGASGVWFNKLTPGYSSTVLSAGFSKAIDKKKHFTFRTAYSRFLYYKQDTSSSYPFKNNFSLGFSFRKKWIGARVYGNLLFGDDSKLNLSTALFSRFDLIHLGHYNKIYMAPEVSAFFSKETVNIIKTDSQTTDQTSAGLKDVFGLMNSQLYVPLGISIGDFDFELSYSVNFPFTQDVNISYPVKSFFSFSIGFMLPIARH